MKTIIHFCSIAACLGAPAAFGACQPNQPHEIYQAQFVINADNTVTDNRTGLVWQRCLVGTSGAACKTGSPQNITWAAALNLTQSEPYASQNWRLPNIKELASIVDHNCVPAIDPAIFPNMAAIKDYYRFGMWSSTPFIGGTTSAAYAVWLDGTIKWWNKMYSNRLLLVRQSQ